MNPSDHHRVPGPHPAPDCSDYCLTSLSGLSALEKTDVSVLITPSRCRMTLNERQITCAPGNILITKGECRFLPAADETPMPALLLRKHFFDSLFLFQMTDCPLFYDFLRSVPEEPRLLHFDCFLSDMSWTIAQVLFYEAAKEPKSLKTVHAAATLLFTNLNEIHRERLLIGGSTMMTEHKIGQVLTYMSNHYRDITLESAAEAFHYHPAYFSSWFKKHAKITFQHQLLKIRLEQARFLLRETTLPVQTVIEEVGFQEKSYFYRCFRKECGMTPLEYRRKVRPQEGERASAVL